MSCAQETSSQQQQQQQEARQEPMAKKRKKAAPQKLDLVAATGVSLATDADTPERPFVCPRCPLQLPVLEAIKHHVRTDHPNLYDPNLDRQSPSHPSK
ncbi:hypothetical protein VP01_947g4 [Puccinia sorghi]|uniref:C2H2-type domain-containing protein n=1 Tax=Puccinia sorghi TaxID=27349 RepID=A0A0L6U719_9BASI|nr:hypothetical protein VP01_947g4 [Puccinia sorghi]